MGQTTGWKSVQTMDIKKQHYFENDETLCGKLFNTDIKVVGDHIPKCKECERILNTRPKKTEQVLENVF